MRRALYRQIAAAQMNSKLKFILPLCLIPVTVLLLYPHENIVAPALRLRVIDEADNPISGVVVKQEWEYMAIGSKLHSASSTTDIDGYVEFPQRSEAFSSLRKALSALGELRNPIHGYRYGPQARVSVYGQEASCEVGRTVPKEFRVQRRRTPGL